MPKSYCYYDPEKGTVCTTDGNGITSVEIYKNKELLFNYNDSIGSENLVKIDAVAAGVSIRVLTTDFRQSYLFRFKEKDVIKKKNLKLISQPR
jgi:hypothetical protein